MWNVGVSKMSKVLNSREYTSQVTENRAQLLAPPRLGYRTSQLSL